MMLNAILQLRRDNDYNYEKIKDKFIPENGEVILVDTARNGLRAKVGNGISTYGDLPFSDENLAVNIFVQGYFYNSQFYFDADYKELIPASINKIYVDKVTNKLFRFDVDEYVLIGVNNYLPASSTQAGVMKLYNELGDNTDGTMTQKAITDELNTKFEVDADISGELLIFQI